MQKNKTLTEYGGRVLESKKSPDGKISFPVVIISQGLGNLADRNYYTAQAIQSGPEVYEGKKAYFDHPTTSQSEEQPGRSVLETAGHYENCAVKKDKDGLMILTADFIPEAGNENVVNKLMHAIEFKKKFPDKDYIGFSINGDGQGVEMEYDDFIKQYKPNASEMKKLAEIAGQTISAITKLTDAVSADLVTEPGAKGRVLIEQRKKQITKKRRIKMQAIESMKKFLFGVEKNDKAMIEGAVKDMLQSEDESKQSAKEDEAKEGAKMEALVKDMLQWKKENEKKEKESEMEYEMRCMKQCKQSEDESKEDEAKEDDASAADDSKDKKDSADDGDDDSKESKEKKEDEDDSGADDAGHSDADQDKALIKKMIKKHDAMQKEMEAIKEKMESFKKESEDEKKESKKQHEEGAKARIALKARESAETIDKELAESGLPRRVTNELREFFVSKNISEAKRKEFTETARKIDSEATESLFVRGTSSGITEISPSDKEATTDHLF